MASPMGSDKNLLVRLNALKPTTINLDESSKSREATSIEPAKPVTREDGLSERLKSLRSQADSTSIPERNTASSAVSEAPEYHEIQPHTSAAASDLVLDGTEKDPPGLVVQNEDIADPLLDTDEQTLEELLADLGSDEQWLEEIAAEVSQSKDEEHQRVTALLEELSQAPYEENEDPKIDDWKRKNDSDFDDDDDFDNGELKRDADVALAKAMDEVELEDANKLTTAIGSPRSQNLAESRIKSDNKLSRNPFDLPTVPTELQDQPDLRSGLQPDDDFEADIAARMAALKGLGGTERALPSAPTSQVDELGLPVAPTFAPGDHPVASAYKRYGYTDEDAKTWCTVCLEDGAIRCIGCDDDIYCARCWKEMHVGPSAGYEERGHQWEKYTRGR